MVVDIAQLHDIQQKNRKTVKNYFKRFINVINKIETVTDDKALDALVTGLHMRTPFWRDIQNSQPKTYSQLVDLIQREIQSKKMIENRERKLKGIERSDVILNLGTTIFKKRALLNHRTTTTEDSTRQR
ncbi:Uncharacterized protein Adt_14725 [Abeliophyllum distichum]|uniref:Retrotransposon gag domain-containing protein n=1 Tax=Abeliophyllum distichum TaxID=126358 RepID=A0ABD1U177_9LAMI